MGTCERNEVFWEIDLLCNLWLADWLCKDVLKPVEVDSVCELVPFFDLVIISKPPHKSAKIPAVLITDPTLEGILLDIDRELLLVVFAIWAKIKTLAANAIRVAQNFGYDFKLFTHIISLTDLVENVKCFIIRLGHHILSQPLTVDSECVRSLMLLQGPMRLADNQ
jgi:hypothetical protein